jgi:hypothetical protein
MYSLPNAYASSGGGVTSKKYTLFHLSKLLTLFAFDKGAMNFISGFPFGFQIANKQQGGALSFIGLSQGGKGTDRVF